MIIGLKCEGCKMWTRLTNENNEHRWILGEGPYYCDECLDNVTYHTTKATITTTDHN